MTQKTMVIDLDRCIGCFACEVACKQENNVALGVYYNKVLSIGPMGKFPDIKQYFLPSICQCCKDAPCVKVCPTGATYRTDDGQILVNKEKCIGCKMCMAACPYGARSYNADTNVVEKCTLCQHLQAVGEKPACVKVCCAKARFFGDIDDPESDVSKASLLRAPKMCIHCRTRAIIRRYATSCTRKREIGRATRRRCSNQHGVHHGYGMEPRVFRRCCSTRRRFGNSGLGGRIMQTPRASDRCSQHHCCAASHLRRSAGTLLARPPGAHFRHSCKPVYGIV